MDRTKRRARLAWILGGVAAILLSALFIFGLRSNQCFDFVPESGKQSFCSSEPIVGYPAAWILGIVSIAFALYAAYRAFRTR